MDFYMKDKHSYLANTLLVRLLVANCADERRQTEKQKDRLTDRQTVLFLRTGLFHHCWASPAAVLRKLSNG